ncbi:MAG: type 1 glutamine amidotransferase domain-containing protein [Myxococcales bacterium]|nr:type 1 glutamine amidotransferase domain-containing protein [Myxococcales bacterium]
MDKRTFLQTTATLATALLLGACDAAPEPDQPLAEPSRAPTHRILLVASSPSTATTPDAQGWPLGAWIAELTHPYYALVDAGYEVELVSTAGGDVFIDPYSDPRHESGYSAEDESSLSFLTTEATASLLVGTRSIEEVDPEDYDAIVIAGGQAPMYTYRADETLQELIRTFYESGRPTAALCHGVASLVDVQTSDGDYLVEGKRLTGFSLAEDMAVVEALGGVEVFEWYVQPTLEERGARYVDGGMWADFAVADGNLITGQQQYSGASVARLVLEALGEG